MASRSWAGAKCGDAVWEGMGSMHGWESLGAAMGQERPPPCLLTYVLSEFSCSPPPTARSSLMQHWCDPAVST
eukprot:scaffold293477_cov28-Tisochrysis_lutea.AAC.3